MVIARLHLNVILIYKDHANSIELVYCHHLQSLKKNKIPEDYTRLKQDNKTIERKKPKNTMTNQENMARNIKKNAVY